MTSQMWSNWYREETYPVHQLIKRAEDKRHRFRKQTLVIAVLLNCVTSLKLWMKFCLFVTGEEAVSFNLPVSISLLSDILPCVVNQLSMSSKALLQLKFIISVFITRYNLNDLQVSKSILVYSVYFFIIN